MIFLPTYDDCIKIVQRNGNSVFYENKKIFDGFNVSLFNYRIAEYINFINPLENFEGDAKELRGLTYVFNEDGSLFNRYLLLTKFWNIGQVAESMPILLNDLKIKAVYEKADGSIIGFIKLPNGKIVARTKMSFDDDRLSAVYKICEENPNILKFVNECFDNDLIPIFEYVSFKNKIVLHYDTSDLVLLRVRNNKTGEYLEVEQFRGKGFSVIKKYDFKSLKDILDLAEVMEGLEGWVVEFENGQLVKIKTEWYKIRHRLLTEELNRENDVIRLILEEKIDDVIAQLNPITDKERIVWIHDITFKIQKFINIMLIDIDELLKDYNGNIKDFALKYKKHYSFHVCMKVIRGDDKYNGTRDYILYHTKYLEEAKKFLNKIN